MAVSATVISVTKEPSPSTRCLVRFDDGVELEFASVEAMKGRIAELDSHPDQARFLLIGWWLARQPNADNTALVEGKTLTFDLSVQNPIRVQ